jgi:hypothetical protein
LRSAANRLAYRTVWGRSRLLDDVGGLRSFLAFDDFKFHFVAFLQAAIAVACDGGIMNEDVGAVLAADESVTLGIVEPLFRSRVRPSLNSVDFWARTTVKTCRHLGDALTTTRGERHGV